MAELLRWTPFRYPPLPPPRPPPTPPHPVISMPVMNDSSSLVTSVSSSLQAMAELLEVPPPPPPQLTHPVAINIISESARERRIALYKSDK